MKIYLINLIALISNQIPIWKLLKLMLGNSLGQLERTSAAKELACLTSVPLRIIRNFTVLILLATSALFIILAQSASAQGVMNNAFYRLQMGNLNSIAGESAGSGYNLSITSGETAPGFYGGTNWNVKAGFQYVPRGGAFTFTISSRIVDFGVLVPTNPITRKITLTVSNTKAPGYQVTASQNHPPQNLRTKDLIPDTTCDNGTCTQIKASDWESALTYGFGYRCDSLSILTKNGPSADCRKDDSSFVNSPNSYKQFADESKKEKAVVVLKGERGRNQRAGITYKVNISTSQATGSYENTATYIATPTF